MKILSELGFLGLLKIKNILTFEEKGCKKMPKMKSRSAARKRFSLTADGHVKRKKAFKSHILNKKDRKRKRNLRKSTLVYDGVEKKVSLMIQL